MNRQDYYDSINKVLVFIQDNIDNDISLNDLSKLAGFSPYHFHRIFTACTGETLSSFVRRIKLEKAAYKLKYDNKNITDVSYEAGYENPAAFTRAFKRLFGVSPSGFRFENNKKYFVQRDDSFYSKIKELAMKNYVETRVLDDQNVIFVRETGNYAKAAEKAWKKVCSFAFPRGLVTKNTKFIGVSYDDPTITPEEKLRYDACLTTEKDIEVKGEFSKQTIQGGKYAIFLHEGPYDGLMNVYQSIFMEWLPESKEELRDLPLFEIYLNSPQNTKPKDLKTEIYIPLK